jgi:hypothetical protein
VGDLDRPIAVEAILLGEVMIQHAFYESRHDHQAEIRRQTYSSREPTSYHLTG